MSQDNQEGLKPLSRRQLIKDMAKVAAGLSVGVAGLATVSNVQAKTGQIRQDSVANLTPLSEKIPQDQSVLRMQREVQKAMEKPAAQRKWGMVIDVRRCVGCATCTVACKAENKLPPGVVYRPVIHEEHGTFPHVARRFIARPCMHCTNPPCTKVCPVGATFKKEDGIVVVDYEKCIGCRYCVSACPYGARTFDWGEYYTDGTPERQKYELSPSFEYGQQWVRAKPHSPINNTRKCHFCMHRLNAGMLPMCVTSCLGRATYFGDFNDPQSLVSELAGSYRVARLKEELGTNPNVYYLT